MAAFALADVIRPESRAGRRRTAASWASRSRCSPATARTWRRPWRDELGIDTVFAEVLPEHKDQKVAELQQPGQARGDGRRRRQRRPGPDPRRRGHRHRQRHGCGHRVGGHHPGAEQPAGRRASIFELSRATYKKMIQNLIWATGYNVVALPLAAGVLAPLGIASLTGSRRAADVAEHRDRGHQRPTAQTAGSRTVARNDEPEAQ